MEVSNTEARLLVLGRSSMLSPRKVFERLNYFSLWILLLEMLICPHGNHLIAACKQISPPPPVCPCMDSCGHSDFDVGLTSVQMQMDR